MNCAAWGLRKLRYAWLRQSPAMHIEENFHFCRGELAKCVKILASIALIAFDVQQYPINRQLLFKEIT
jgi:hypothetical protein